MITLVFMNLYPLTTLLLNSPLLSIVMQRTKCFFVFIDLCFQMRLYSCKCNYNKHLSVPIWHFGMKKCRQLMGRKLLYSPVPLYKVYPQTTNCHLMLRKQKFMIFHHKQRNIENLIPQLNLNEQIIERVTDFNFLGLTIDQHLTWNGHVQKY